MAQSLPSILSVTLFSLKINKIVDVLSSSIDGSLFVDDFFICMRSKNMRTIERQLQQSLNNLQIWADKNGFKFSKSKTVYMHFCQLRKVHDDPHLYLNGTAIPVVEETKFLGVVFDHKLSFKPHIQYLKDKCSKTLNLMKMLAHTDWGADRTPLLRLYRTLVRSKLDYACTVYGSARASYLQPLNAIHHQGLRLALGAFRTTPIQSLYVEANEPSLEYRREKLSLQYALRVKSNPENPAFDPIFNPKYKTLFVNKPRAIPTFGLRLSTLLEDSNLNLDNISTFNNDTAPWSFSKPQVDLSLHKNSKSATDPSRLSTFTLKHNFGT